MNKIAAALVKAQKARDFESEAMLLKQYFDLAVTTKKVNQHTAQPMPSRLTQKVVFGASDCWIFVGHVDAIGYGRMAYAGENKAHRVSYKYFNGDIPEGMNVLHKCDVRQCVNPDHLFLGSQADNVHDMCLKGRNVAVPKNGEQNPMAKITREQVEQIRELKKHGWKQSDIARKYGVSPMTVSRVVRKESWK